MKGLEQGIGLTGLYPQTAIYYTDFNAYSAYHARR
jgi:hypothetical protein